MTQQHQPQFESLPEPEILLHDGPCIFVNKPGGVLTQAPPGIDSMELRVKQYLRRVEEKKGKIYLGVPHRLDRPVSGAMVFARHIRATQRIAAQFERREVKKVYWAIVDGKVEPESGRWIDYMRKMADRAQSEIVDPAEEKAQEAILRYRVIKTVQDKSWLEIELETGRTHQIRLQCSHHGFPIWGDEQYGSAVSFGPQVVDQRQKWIALFSRHLNIHHPMEDRDVEVVVPVPSAWHEIEGFDFNQISADR